MNTRCICGCGARAVQQHHVLTRQALRREGGDPMDRRNLVPIALGCHGAHHARLRPLPLVVLPDSVFEFARDLLGGPAAHVWLGRYYEGRDPRHDALLEEEGS